jgi:hypothetical protein
MRFGTWSVKSQHRAATRKLARYKLDLVGVQELRWDKGSMLNAGPVFFMEKKTEIITWEQAFS